MNRPIFNPKAEPADTRRREWVPLEGGFVCVWGMTAGDAIFVTERARRPLVVEGQSALDHGQARVWQIICSCYDSDEIGAKRVFGMEDALRIHQLSEADYIRLLEAIDRVAGMDEKEVTSLRDFFPEPTMAGLSER